MLVETTSLGIIEEMKLSRVRLARRETKGIEGCLSVDQLMVLLRGYYSNRAFAAPSRRR